MYLYLATSGLSCGMQDLHDIVCSLSLQCMKLSTCVTWVPEHVGSVVAARGFNCSVARRNLVLHPEIKPASPALQGGCLTTGPPGKFPRVSSLKMHREDVC